ncbi:hypothetical protein ACIRJR_28720 [Streptomyces sp. NPDC102402]|uniref:hypothetical protein n=1 Tax=Streptomyces sp. NPDC102402 TaxID=3366169 RepID=UPI00382C6C5E
MRRAEVPSRRTVLRGPGRNSFTVAEDGRADVLVHHARPYEEITGDPPHDPTAAPASSRSAGERTALPASEPPCTREGAYRPVRAQVRSKA